MPAKKAASKKRKKAATSRRKVARRKTTKKKVARKKAVSKKKAPARKKKIASKKAAGKKKVAKKKTTGKKTAKKAGGKKPAAGKKSAGKKRPAARKKTAGKKRPAARKKAPARKTAARRKTPARKSTARKAPARRAQSRGDVLSGPIHGIAPYKARRGEEYMSDDQLDHFRNILNAWKRELMFEVDRTVHHMQDEAANFPDPNDRATQESEFGLELRTRDRERKLLRKIDSALARIDEGSYGYCDETGEEIGLKHLEARPVATLCLEAQERREMAERQFRDRDDRYR